MEKINHNKLDKLTSDDIPAMFWFTELCLCKKQLSEMDATYVFRKILMRQSIGACKESMLLELEHNPIYLQ